MKSTKRKKSRPDEEDVMKPHYDFSKGEKPNYAKRFRNGAIITVKGSNGSRHKRIEAKSLVILDADVSKVFPDTQSVNAALRHLIQAVPKRSWMSR
ncbi:MAG: hypothetical protein ACHQNE_03340 [Candidatus Kapaibacterium sp.]